VRSGWGGCGALERPAPRARRACVAAGEAHRPAARQARGEAFRRVVSSLAKVPDAAAHGAHAERSACVVQDAVRARLPPAPRRPVSRRSELCQGLSARLTPAPPQHTPVVHAA
jgi:hypothetical protein